MEEQLGSKEDLLGIEKESNLSRLIENQEEFIEEGGQHQEELTHWIMPDHVFMTHVKESWKNDPIAELRDDADKGESWINITKEDLLAY